jgi:hypothetical protein
LLSSILPLLIRKLKLREQKLLAPGPTTGPLKKIPILILTLDPTIKYEAATG